MTLPASDVPAPPQRASLSRRIVAGWALVGTMLACAAVFCAGNTGFSQLQPSGRLIAEIEYPAAVRVGERFELVLHLTNHSPTDLSVGDIDLSQAPGSEHASVLTGATVERTEPTMPSTPYPMLKLHSFQYYRVVRAGETETVVFRLRPVEPGEFHTSIDVYLDDETIVIWDFGITISP